MYVVDYDVLIPNLTRTNEVDKTSVRDPELDFVGIEHSKYSKTVGSAENLIVARTEVHCIVEFRAISTLLIHFLTGVLLLCKPDWFQAFFHLHFRNVRFRRIGLPILSRCYPKTWV